MGDILSFILCPVPEAQPFLAGRYGWVQSNVHVVSVAVGFRWFVLEHIRVKVSSPFEEVGQSVDGWGAAVACIGFEVKTV